MSNIFLPNAYVKGQLKPFEEAQVSIATHALHYGTAAFAGLRVAPDNKLKGNVTLFRLEQHAKRLSQSARLLGHSITPDDITKAIKKVIAANPGDQAYYLRPLVYASDLGIAPRIHDIEFDLIIYGVAMGEYLSSDSISTCFSSWIRSEDRSVPLRGKISGTYVTSALAKSEAVNRGFDEALLLNTRGKVAEGSAMNIFMVKDGALVTPSVSQDILEGITRRSVIELAKELNITVQEREVDKSELILADEAFLTGTAARIAPIGRIEQYDLLIEHPITKTIADKLKAIVEQKTKDHSDWITSLPALDSPVSSRKP
jgi:branched-chain amino acid aminotransferase